MGGSGSGGGGLGRGSSSWARLSGGTAAAPPVPPPAALPTLPTDSDRLLRAICAVSLPPKGLVLSELLPQTVLHALVRARPVDRDGLRAIAGGGEAKLGEHAQAALELIGRTCSQLGLPTGVFTDEEHTARLVCSLRRARAEMAQRSDLAPCAWHPALSIDTLHLDLHPSA